MSSADRGLPLNTSKQIVSLIYWQASERDVVNGEWFWRDEFCEEPMGPFDSRAEAAADYRALRHPSSQST
jgi:hypothetical protein